jgi:hypothetical protein
VFVRFDDTRQLGLDCFARLAPRRGIAFGWTMVPRGVEGRIDVTAGAEAACRMLHASFHERPDVAVADPRACAVRGFTLVFELPEPMPAGLTLALTAGDARIPADLLSAEVERSLAKATAARRWPINAALLRDAAREPELAPMMTHQDRPFGAFADWLAAMPVVRGRATNQGRIAEAEALQTASGELLVMLRADGPLPPEARLDAAVFGWVRARPGAAAEPRLLELADWHAARLPTALAAYCRLGGPLADRLQAVEIVVQAELEPGEALRLRCHPAPAGIPHLLDAASRATAASLSVPVEAAGSAGLALLREVIARREAAFAPMIEAFGRMAAAPPAARPRTALLLGADEPEAARLCHVTAPLFARHCDRLLVLGAAADDVAQAFAAVARPEVLVGEAALGALRLAAGAGGVLALEAAGLAAAVIADDPDAAFTEALGGAELARLLALHAVGGCAPALADSLQRLLHARRPGAAGRRFAPLARSWSSRHAAEPVHAHLERLWASATGPSPTAPAAAAHG